MKSGGLFITSGIIAAKEKVISEALEKAGFTIEEVLRMEDCSNYCTKCVI